MLNTIHRSSPFQSLLRPAFFRIASLALIAVALAPQAGASQFDTTDLHHEVLVRTAMAEDSRLQWLNIFVRVKDRVATLSGPVPTRELARRALDVAKSVPEIREVHDRMMVHYEDRGLLLPVNVAIPSKTAAQTSLSMAPPFDEKAVRPVKAISAWRPVPADQPVLPARQDAGVLPSFLTQPSTAEPTSRSKEKETVQSPAPKRLDVAAIGSAVETLVLGEERYRRLRWEVQGSKVFVSGVIASWSDLRDLAKVLRQVPGINEVVIRDLRVEPIRD
jgi:osmotically-inducible protein OsmY